MGKILDVIIIGAGTAGLSALRELRGKTDNFVIVNDGPYGTTCARVGCMPSKALIEAANAFDRRRAFGDFGIRGAEALSVDIPAVMRRVRALRDRFVAGTVAVTGDLGSRNIAGRARFVAPNAVEVNGQRLEGRKIVIATGSRPIVPKEWTAFRDRVMTSDDIFERETLPPRIAVVGLGGVGAEIAQALARLGIKVTGYGRSPFISGLTDSVVNEQAVAALDKEFPLHLGNMPQVEANGSTLKVRAGNSVVEVDAIFSAMGRRPNVDDLGLEHLGVKLEAHGVPPFNRNSMQIADLPVFIAGDVTGELQLLHEASDEGHIGGANALRDAPVNLRRRTRLAIVFTDPNIAIVGRRFADLDKEQILVGAVDFSDQGRSRMAAENRGALRVYARKLDGRILGCELCAPHGEHLAHLLALAIDRQLTVLQLLQMPFYHPVFEEGLRTALRQLAMQLPPVPHGELSACSSIGAAALE